jgi:hypothetical protein
MFGSDVPNGTDNSRGKLITVWPQELDCFLSAASLANRSALNLSVFSRIDSLMA